MKLDLTTGRVWKAAYVASQIRLAHSLPGPDSAMIEVEKALRKALAAEPMERLAERVAERLERLRLLEPA